MRIQQQYLEYADRLKLAVQPVFDFGGNELSLKQELAALFKDLKERELIVPVVGGFSAGKSSLINSFLGKSFLSVAITPETALATELRYDENERIEAVASNGSIDRYRLDQADEIKQKSGNYEYLRYFIHSDKLKQISPLVLVDMPGFGSARNGDDRSIMLYSHRGVYFIVLISVEDGTLQKSIGDCIDELNGYKTAFKFGLTKTNLRPPSLVKDVKNKLQEQLEDEFDYSDDIIEFNKNGGENLTKILTEIDPENLFKALFEKRLTDNNKKLLSQIETKIKTLQISKEEAEQAILEIRDKSNQMQADNQRVIKQMKDDSQNDVPAMIQAVIFAVDKQTDRLANLAMRDRFGMQEEVLDLVKLTLSKELKEKISRQLEKAGRGIRVNFKNATISGFSNLDMDTSFIQEIIERSLQTIEESGFDFTDLADTLSKLSATLSLIFGGIFKIIDKILTYVKGFVSIFFSKSEPEKEDPLPKIKQAIKGEIINQLENELNDKLPDAYQKILVDVVKKITDSLTENLKQYEQSIQEELAQHEKNAGDNEKRLKLLQETKQQISNLAAQYLN